MMGYQGPERRRHKRHEMACPLALLGADGAATARSKTIDLSDGGLLVSLPDDRAPESGAGLRVKLSVPRSTPNTYMLEEFGSSATVVRREPLAGKRLIGVALQFGEPLRLGIEV